MSVTLSRTTSLYTDENDTHFKGSYEVPQPLQLGSVEWKKAQLTEKKMEAAANDKKLTPAQLKRQHKHDLRVGIFKNLDISQMIFKFKRESNRLDQIERNKSAVIYELNTLSSWELPMYARRFSEEGGRPVPTSLKLFWQLWYCYPSLPPHTF